MEALNKLVRENILRLQPYSSARDEYQGKEGILLDANESPFGPFNRYPDPFQTELKQAIARFRNLPVENLFLSNGSDESIDLVIRIFCQPGRDRILTLPPTYGMYRVSAGINDIDIVEVPLLPDFQPDLTALAPLFEEERNKLLFLCSPNNPTGNLLNKEAVEWILQEFRGVVVIDEAYMDFAQEPSWTESLNKYPRLVVLQTLSKAMGMAGLRVGMAWGSPTMVQLLNKVKPPYNLSAASQSAALKGLENPLLIQGRIQELLRERENLVGSLEKLECVEQIFPSQANFLLVRFRNASTVFRNLREQQIIVRDRSAQVPGCLRITVGSPDENRMLIQTLQTLDV